MRIPKLHSRRPAAGSIPGTVTVQPDARPPKMDVLTFGPEADPATVKRLPVASIDALPDLPPGHTTRWLNVAGLGDAEVLQAIGRRFDIHPLALEDIANTWQRPKVDDYDSCLFLVTRVPADTPRGLPTPAAPSTGNTDLTASALTTRQVALCLGRDFVITFQEQEEAIFESVRHRLLRRTGRLYQRGPDYLAYALIDAAIDAFFPLLEHYGEAAEELEAAVIEEPDTGHIGRIHGLKRSLLTVRRTIWPQREMLNNLIRDETPFVTEETRLFLRDCYDHTIQLLDSIETSREIAIGLVDILLSSQSNRLNEVMKVLTIIATIFIPLSFVAGVYGMNFDTNSPWNMPELSWQYGYLAFWGVIIAISGSLLLWFRYKGWIGRGGR